MDQLDEGSRGEVMLLCAAPGSGKTLLVRAWADAGRPAGPVAWLALDAHDNDPVSFWSYVLGSLRSTGAVPDGGTLARIRPGRRVDEPFVRRVAGGLAELPGPVVLVLDDLHEIHHPQILESLAFLLRHPVRNLRLVVTTRVDPALPLHQPRMRNGVAMIRTAELAFTLDEATALLAAHHVRITAAETKTLLDRTEGWAVGLCLAATFLGGRHPTPGISEFTGTEPAVTEYLMSEVLAREPPEVHRFLRMTSVVDEVSGELADALTGETHGYGTLERLADAHAGAAPTVDGSCGAGAGESIPRHRSAGTVRRAARLRP